MIRFKNCLLLLFFLPLTSHAAFDSLSAGDKLRSMATQAGSFAKARGYNDAICFLLDLSVNSGKNRFFVYELRQNKVTDAGLVAHGHCHQWVQRTIQFSNAPGCACSSSGRYKIGAAYQGKFGTAFKLTGLDKTNSNAAKRAIVLHAHSCVPDKESYPQEICRSEGCTTVSPAFLKRLGKLIRASEKPILMWVYQ
jgi:hypothetical protein